MKGRKIKIIIICVLIISAVITFFMSPVFNIKTIEVAAMDYYDNEAILKHLEDLKGKNGFYAILQNTSIMHSKRILSMELEKKENKLIFECPYLRDVKIKYKMPNKIIVETYERIPIFLAEHYSIYLYIDSEGYLLSTFTEDENKPKLPVVQGLNLSGYKVGRAITNKEDKKIDTVIKICNLMKELSMLEENIDIIDVTEINDIWFYVSPSLSIRIGDTENLGVKLAMLKEIQKNGYDGNSNGTLDFSHGGNPVFRENKN